MVSPAKKSIGAKRGRLSHGPTHERVTITLPVATLQGARQRAAAAGASSLSAYIAAQLEESERGESYREYLAERFRDQPMTEEEQRWADSLLGL